MAGLELEAVEWRIPIVKRVELMAFPVMVPDRPRATSVIRRAHPLLPPASALASVTLSVGRSVIRRAASAASPGRRRLVASVDSGHAPLSLSSE